MADQGTLLVVLDLCGIFVFAITGALVGVRKRLDIFGLRVLALRRNWHAPLPSGSASV